MCVHRRAICVQGVAHVGTQEVMCDQGVAHVCAQEGGVCTGGRCAHGEWHTFVYRRRVCAWVAHMCAQVAVCTQRRASACHQLPSWEALQILSCSNLAPALVSMPAKCAWPSSSSLGPQAVVWNWETVTQ